MKTAKFIDSKYDSSKRLKKDRWTEVEVIDTLIPVAVELHGTKKEFYVRGMDVAWVEEHGHYNSSLILYNEDGSKAYGIWRHGYQGDKLHRELIFVRGQERKLETKTTYINGRKKDSYKYLLSLEAAK